MFRNFAKSALLVMSVSIGLSGGSVVATEATAADLPVRIDAVALLQSSTPQSLYLQAYFTCDPGTSTKQAASGVSIRVLQNLPQTGSVSVTKNFPVTCTGTSQAVTAVLANSSVKFHEGLATAAGWLTYPDGSNGPGSDVTSAIDIKQIPPSQDNQ